MPLSLLVTIDVLLGLLGMLGVAYAAVSMIFDVWKKKLLLKDSNAIFRSFKTRVFALVDGQHGIRDDIREEEEEQKVTPEDHVEVQKRLRKAELLLSNNEFEEAEKLLVETLSINDADEDVNLLLAYIYMKRKKYSKAENIYLKLIEMKSKDPSVYGNLGKVLEKQGNMETAIVAYQEAVKREPHEGARYVQLAHALVKAGHLGEAVAAFEEAVRFDSRNTEYLFSLAQAYLRSDSPQLAAKIFIRILEIEPYNERAKVQLMDLQDKGFTQDTSL